MLITAQTRSLKKKGTKLTLLFNQFKNPLIAVLIAAAIISLIVDHAIDAVVIAVVIVINTGIGFFQEFKAETALDALKSLASPETKVVGKMRRKMRGYQNQG